MGEPRTVHNTAGTAAPGEASAVSGGDATGPVHGGGAGPDNVPSPMGIFQGGKPVVRIFLCERCGIDSRTWDRAHKDLRFEDVEGLPLCPRCAAKIKTHLEASNDG